MNEWPDTLKMDPGAVQALNRIEEEVPLRKTWDDERSFEENGQAEAIANVLIPEFHTSLVNADVRHLFKKTIKARGVAVWATASKADPKLRYFEGLDFLITYNWLAWGALPFVARVALVDHELTHCLRGEDAKGETKRVMVPHDIEEFTSIVARWGLWRPSVKTFVDVATQQLMLPV